MTTHEPDQGGTPLHHAETADDIDPDAARSGVPTGGPSADPEEPEEDPHARGGSGDPDVGLHHRDTADRIDPTAHDDQ